MRERDAKFSQLMGSRARRLRELKDLSVEDVAARAYLHVRDVVQLEAGKVSSAAMMRRVAEALGTPPHELMDPNLSYEYYSVFISYGGPDTPVATRIYNELRQAGVPCFFFPVSAKPGQRLHRTMSEGIAHYDRVILLCSATSLARAGVQNELEQVLIREAREGGAELLIPVALDDFVFSAWSPSRPDLAAQIRARVVADFRDVTPRHRRWGEQIGRLVQALRKAST